MKWMQSLFKRYVLTGSTLGGITLSLCIKVQLKNSHAPLQLSPVSTQCSTLTRSSVDPANDLSSSLKREPKHLFNSIYLSLMVFEQSAILAWVKAKMWPAAFWSSSSSNTLWRGPINEGLTPLGFKANAKHTPGIPTHCNEFVGSYQI